MSLTLSSPIIDALPALFRPPSDEQIRAQPWERSVEIELERRSQLMRLLAANRSMLPQVAEACKRDACFFVGNFGWGFDARLPEPMQPLLLLNDQRAYLYCLTHPDFGRALLEKSRDRGASVLLAWAVLQTWGLRGKNWGLLTRVGKDLDDGTYDSLFGKLDWNLGVIPPFLISPSDWKRSGKPNSMFIHRRTGAVIKGGATTGGALRGARFWKVAVDEAAHIQIMGRLMSSLQGLTDNLVFLSSVNGMGNVFADIRHSRNGYQAVPFDPLHLSKQTSTLGGKWCILRLHYSEDHRRDAKWVEEKRAGMDTADWGQEYEINYSTSTKWRIFPELDVNALTYTQEEWADIWHEHAWSAQILNAFDFGSGTALTCYASGLYFASADTLIFWKHHSWRERHWRDVAEDYANDGWNCHENPTGVDPYKLLGDQAGKARNSAQSSWINDLKTAGISIEPRTIRNFQAASAKANLAIKKGKIRFAPSVHDRSHRDLPSLAESLSSWKYKVAGTGEDTSSDGKPDKLSIYSHLSDCFLYITNEIWGESTPKAKRLHA